METGTGLKLTDGLVDTENQTRSLGGGLDGVDLDERGLPDKGGHVVPDALVVKVDAGPDVALSVLDAESVEDIRGVEAGVVAELAGDDLEGLGKGLDDALLFVRDLAVGKSVQVF